LAPSFYKGGN